MIAMSLVFISFLSISVESQTIHQKSSKELESTQKLLLNQKKREAYIKNHSGAQQVDQSVKSLVGSDPALTQELYSIAAELLAQIEAKSKKPNGEVDIEKMKRWMLKYQTNPEAFYREMDIKQRKKIQQLGKKIGPVPASQK